MSKDIIVVYHCDMCGGEFGEGHGHIDLPWAFGGKQFEVDLDDTCHEKVTDSVTGLMAASRSVATKAAKAPRKSRAKAPDEGTRDYPERRFNPNVYEVVFGVPGAPEGYTRLGCPICGNFYERQNPKGTVSSLRTHMTLVHDVKPITYIEDWLIQHPEVEVVSIRGGWVIADA